MFTKEICEKVIFFEPGSEPVRSTDQCFDSYPCVFNTLSFELSATDLLVSLADVISGMEDSLYSFYITINDYCRIENCITAVVWGTDEEILIELDEEEYKEIVLQVDSLSFDKENFYSDTSLEVREKFVYKAILIQSILRILSSDKANNLLNKNIMTTFIDKVINKSQEFYLNKLGKNYHCLFRREQIYDDLLKYSLFIFGNDYYYADFFPFVKALLAIDISESTSLDITAEFFKLFLSIRNIPKIIIILMKILQKQSVEHFEMESDNFYVCFVYLFFNFLCSPKINEIYNIGISSNVKISLVNKMIMNVCYKQKFSESEKEILFFNDFIDTLNFQLKKNLKEAIETIQWEDIDKSIEEELQRYGLKESNLFINAYDCYLVKKMFGNKEQYQFI